MEKLSIEEKAKAYDKAFEIMKAYYNRTQFSSISDSKEELKTIEKAFPELKESEDERIRNEIIAFVEQSIHRGGGTPISEEQETKWITWLEKQGNNNMGISEATKQKLEDNLNKALEKETPESWNKFLEEQGEQNPAEEFDGEDYGIDGLWHAQNILEKTLGEVDGYQSDDGILEHKCAISAVNKLYEQKPIAWSEEDETTKNNISHIIRQYDKISKSENQPCYYVGNCLLWMQNIKERVQSQQKQEWSEDDERKLTDVIVALSEYANGNIPNILPSMLLEDVEWLKLLKERYTWKPSDRQMQQLGWIAEQNEHNLIGKELMTLYKDLKKLREK